ncbi:MAG TPA: hypothetical protein VKU40_10940, partial [Thermoanaerobaculia bacterium]|nr:hypothetical protein [Thermoanaerobaculia bacterium]
MQQFAFFAELLHPGLRPADAAEPLAPLAAARTDRARLALLLEGAALLAHLDHAGLRLAAGWDGAGLDADGHLAVPPPHPGRAAELPQVELADLLARLFRIDGRRRLAGRGEARRAVRAVQRRCRQGLIALPPDLLVAQLLDEAPFLFEPPFATTRRRLAGHHRRDGEERPWVAGPGPFRWRLLAAAGDDAEALGDLLASPRAAELHRGAPPADGTTAGELAAAGRWRAAVAAWESQPPADAEERCAFATAWLGLGRGRRALAALGDDRRDPAALPVVAAALLQLGRLRALLHADRGADPERLDPDDRLAVDAAVVRALANGGDAAAARERALAAVEREARAPLARRAHAHLVAAQAAWDGRDEAATADHLSRAASLADDPELAPALSQTRALAALAAGRPRRAGEEIAGALARHRRRLPRATAAGLWNDLGLARALTGDLAGAEKALGRALALYRGCDGPRVSTVALANLAEVRLRRGRLAGVEEMLERVAAANRAAGNRRGSASDLVSWGRCELAHGRAAAALALLRRAVDRAEGL